MPAAALIGTAFHVPPCGITFFARSGSSGVKRSARPMSAPDFSKIALDLSPTGTGPARDPWNTPEGLTVAPAYAGDALKAGAATPLLIAVVTA